VDGDERDRLTRLEARVEDIDRRLADLGSINSQMATVNANLGHMDRDLTMLRDEIEGVSTTLASRDQAVSKERRDTRLALYSMAGVLGASFVSGVVAVIVGLIGG
jgi:archaellum component FlaC